MAELKLKTVTRTQSNNQALKDDTVKPQGTYAPQRKAGLVSHWGNVG